MPLPARPTGPVPPSDLLWRHELQGHNDTLLRRMNALEAKFTDQERRVQVAEEAATTCTSMAGEFSLIKHDVDQIEAKQQEFMSGVHKRLVDMDKDMGEFRKTQERVQKLMSSYRELDDSIVDLSTLGPRVESAEREIQGLKNSVGRKHVHEMESLDARLEMLELQRSREAAQIRNMQEEFSKKYSGDLQTLRTEVAKLTATGRTAEVQQPYIQVPRSPDMLSRPTNSATTPNHPANGCANISTSRAQVLHQTARNPPSKAQQAPREVETQGTTQTSAPAGDIESLDLDATFIPFVPPSNPNSPPSHLGPEKKPTETHTRPQPKAQSKARPEKHSRTQTRFLPKNLSTPQTMVQSRSEKQPKMQPPIVANRGPKPAPKPLPSKVVKLPASMSKKRSGSPISTPRPAKEPHVASSSRQQVNPAQKDQGKSREKQQQQQPARRSRRRSANATFYELGWDQTQQPQKTAGPVYGSTSRTTKGLKTKPRRLPPVPDE
ncbi:uncharacterized protein CC84DRAFT_1215271 [Paraphaeosphaeria sporulosa]|uniref:Uncharacterized protein n=1 Tax=Paraphaeosphaeria sporulosa TaxID=1460663 RepID=A0A177CNL7_9PLEO|nr:uncharacterized protein CC84DRAFT_1215271 [Paraphaeosphaeria sporulosa]OAG08801.1 hypothetical protein CC84DRAFT_1215271 [Paraphaeosphaeria sporulosa]